MRNHPTRKRQCSETAALIILAAVILAGGDRPAHSEDPKPQPVTPSDCRRSSFRTVIDVGHTIKVPGADSARGVPEYSFNLRLADVITKAMTDAGFEKTVRMLTTTPPWHGLVERAERANKMHADLFVSIHHDSVPTFLIKNWEFEGQTHQYNDSYTGYAIFVSNDNGDLNGSLAFGRYLGKELEARGMHYTPHYTEPLMRRYRHALLDTDAGVYRFDQLVVLRKTLMPAVLLEAGSIVNRQEELDLGTDQRHVAISAAFVAAVEEFCAARARPKDRLVRNPAGAAMRPTAAATAH